MSSVARHGIRYEVKDRESAARERAAREASLRTAGAATTRNRLRPSMGAYVAILVLLIAMVPASGTAVVTAASSAQLVASPTSTKPGSTITVLGSGFAKNQKGSITLDTGTAGVAFRANGKGAFSISLGVPVNAATGQHNVAARSTTTSAGSTTPVSLASTTITVVASPAATATPTLAPPPAPTPTHTPTPSATPAPTSTPAPASTPSSPPSPFVTACGTRFCLGGRDFVFRGATAYGQYGNPNNEVSLATQGNLTVLELVEFDTRYHDLTDVESNETWNRVDKFIAAARSAGLHVVLNLSEYGQSLQADGQVAATVDWGPYLRFIANRTNTVTGVRYSADPTIAMVELWGEIPAPAYPNPAGTTQQITDFFARSIAEWTSYAPNILISTGGFSYLNDAHSGLDWKTIMANPDNAACGMEINSIEDRDITVANVSNYCKTLGKPWFLAAWAACGGAGTGYDTFSDDASMAAHALDMEQIAAGAAPAAMPALGIDFWNLGPQQSPTCDIGPQFPLSWQVIAGA